MITESNDFGYRMIGYKERWLDMKKRCVCILVMGLTMAVLTACSNAGESVPQTYGINPASAGNDTEQDSPESEYEISDMLPRPSDDTLIMSVEEAEEFMKKRARTYTDIDESTDTE